MDSMLTNSWDFTLLIVGIWYLGESVYRWFQERANREYRANAGAYKKNKNNVWERINR